MLICTRCNIEYEEETDFCPQCGGPLTTKEELASGNGASPKVEETKQDERMICPSCKILYERMKTCIRCGAPLVKQSDLKELEESKLSQSFESKEKELRQEPLQVHPPEKETTEKTMEMPKPFYAAEVEQQPSSPETPEKRPTKELPEDLRKKALSLEKGKKNFLHSPILGIGVIVLIVAAIYLLWSLFFSTKRPGEVIGPSTSTDVESLAKEGSTVSNEALSSSSIPVVSVAQEIEGLKEVLENIRQANLKKNINLFMSCYAADYEDREGRREATLESWSKFNFLELSYNLKVNSVSRNFSEARVQWWIRFIPKKGGQADEIKNVLDVKFQKENNEWKIKEVKPIS
jgi:RNA polymerase subunit RPABC4/transcription elongation factor Spt4